MAKTKIHTLSYHLTLDAQGFNNGIERTKKEMAEARRVMKSTITPLEKYENEIRKLEHLQKKGIITQTSMNRAVKLAGDRYKKATQSAGLFGKKVSVGMAAATAGVLAFGMALRRVSGAMVQTIARVDGLAKRSKSLGVSTEFLTRLQFAAGQTSGLSDEATAKGLENMTKKISEAALGTGEAIDALDELGLSAERLTKLGPEQTFLELSKAMKGVVIPADRLMLATKIFGRQAAKMNLTLGLSVEAMAKLQQQSDALGKTLSTTMAIRMEDATDRMGEMKAASEGMWNSITLAGVPAIDMLTNAMSHLAEVAQNVQATMGGVALFMQRIKQNPLQNPITLLQSSFIDAAGAVSNQAAAAENKRDVELKENLALQTAKDEAANKKKIRGELLGGMVSGALGGLIGTGKFAAGKTAQAFNETPGMRTVSQVKESFSGPSESITAGSSEAFKIANRTKSTETVKVKMQREQISIAKRSEKALWALVGTLKDETSEVLGL